MKVDGARVTVDVRNAGDRAGDEVVQLYVHNPVSDVSRPVKELKAFRRISLKAGETRRMEFAVPAGAQVSFTAQ